MAQQCKSFPICLIQHTQQSIVAHNGKKSPDIKNVILGIRETRNGYLYKRNLKGSSHREPCLKNTSIIRTLEVHHIERCGSDTSIKTIDVHHIERRGTNTSIVRT